MTKDLELNIDGVCKSCKTRTLEQHTTFERDNNICLSGDI